MKKMHDIMKATSPGSCDDSPKTNETPNKVIIRVFAVLAAQYGNRWVSLITSEEADQAMRKVWGDAISDIPLETIKSALDKLPSEYPNWPPTVGQFLEICKIGKGPDMQPKLPKPRGDESIALAALEEMKNILK